MLISKSERIKVLKKAATDKRESAEKVAESAIDEMSRKGVPINFEAVAKVSGLSKMYLYKHSGLSAKIKALRLSHHTMDAETSLKMKVKEQEQLITVLKNKVLSKNFEIKQLKKQLEVVYGELYRKK